jgi:hypothetical protein
MALVEVACVEGNKNKEIGVIHTPTPIVPPAGGTNRPAEALHKPTRVAKDMAFLKESWANMVEAEEDTTQNVEDTILQDEGFQIHLSKNK